MGEQYYPSQADQKLFREIRQEIADHPLEYEAVRKWFDADFSITAIEERRSKADAERDAIVGISTGRRVPTAPDNVAMVQLREAEQHLRPQGRDLGSISRARRFEIIRRVLFIAWLQTDPDAEEIGTGVFPWDRSHWDDPDLPGEFRLTRWWARQVAFDPDYDPKGEWIALVRQSLELVREEQVATNASRASTKSDTTEVECVGSAQEASVSEVSQHAEAGFGSSTDALRGVVGDSPKPQDPLPDGHATDFLWLRVKGCTYQFTTPTQRQLMSILYRVWSDGGRVDGIGCSLAQLQEELDTNSSRLRVPRVFEGTGAIETILCKVGRDAWALYLNDPRTPPTDGREIAPR